MTTRLGLRDGRDDAWMRVLWAMLLSFSFSTASAETYPFRPVRVIAPFAAGGITDVLARIVADGLRNRFKQTVFVENKPGGNGTIGMREVVRAAPDGHTLLIGSLGGQAVRAAMDSRYPFDPVRDLTPVAGAAEYAAVMVVNRKAPVNSVAEFIAYAKSRPDRLNFGSTGLGSVNHLAAALFTKATGLELVGVQYKGGSGSINDLLGGSLDVIFEVFPTAMGQIVSGNVKALAVTSPYRLKNLPDVPTMKEAGLPYVTLTGWSGVYGPRGLSETTRDQLSDAVVDLIKTPKTQAQLRSIGFEPVVMGAVEFAAFQAAEVKRWNEFIIAEGLRQ